MSIYVVGHKNPDTDSICAAISYAAFKQAMGEDARIALRNIRQDANSDVKDLKLPEDEEKIGPFYIYISPKAFECPFSAAFS